MPIHRVKSLDQMRVEAIQSDYKYKKYKLKREAEEVRKDKSDVEEWLREFNNAKRQYEERRRVQSTEVH